MELLVRSRRCGLRDHHHEFEGCSVSLELHHIFVERELNRSVQRNDVLLVGLWLSNHK